MIKINKPLAEKRRIICAVCEFKSLIGQCQKCGCFIYAKSLFEDQLCPIGKWDNVENG